MPKIIITPYTNRPGKQWKAALIIGNGSTSYYGSTVTEAEARLRENVDCGNAQSEIVHCERKWNVGGWKDTDNDKVD